MVLADIPRSTRRSAARVTAPIEERPKRDLPDKPDEHFYNELMYIRHEKDLQGKKIHVNIKFYKLLHTRLKMNMIKCVTYS